MHALSVESSSAQRIHTQPRPVASAGVAPDTPGRPFAAVLASMAHELDRGQDTLDAALRAVGPAGATNAGLIALQVGAYRVSELVDVTSRLVDRMAGSVKTVMQGGGG